MFDYQRIYPASILMDVGDGKAMDPLQPWGDDGFTPLRETAKRLCPLDVVFPRQDMVIPIGIYDDLENDCHNMFTFSTYSLDFVLHFPHPAIWAWSPQSTSFPEGQHFNDVHGTW